MIRPARALAADLFERLAEGAKPAQLAEFFDNDVDWYIPGDTATVPWTGRKVGRAGVAEFYQQLHELTVPHEFTVETILGDAERCVALGHLRTEALATGAVIESAFAFDIKARNNLITRYHMFEDTWATADAFRS